VILALLLAQLAPATPSVPSPIPIISPIETNPNASPLSERSLLAQGLQSAAARAKVLGGTLGAVIVDLGNGASVDINGDVSLPMQSVQKLPVAVVVYREIDAGRLKTDQTIHVMKNDLVPYASSVNDDYAKRTDYSISELTELMVEESDNSAQQALIRIIGGIDTVNADMANLGYGAIYCSPSDDGYAKPLALSQFLADLNSGKLLSQSSTKIVLGMMAKASTFPGRLRAGFPAGTLVEHKTGTSGTVDGVRDATNDVGIVQVNGRTLIVVAMLHGAWGKDSQRDAILASVSRTAYEATRQFPI